MGIKTLPAFCKSFLRQFHTSLIYTQWHPSFDQFDKHDQHFGYPYCKKKKKKVVKFSLTNLDAQVITLTSLGSSKIQGKKKTERNGKQGRKKQYVNTLKTCITCTPPEPTDELKINERDYRVKVH